ncbi:unnamed protein product [Cyclocybe aegerita]|uniref:tRNA (cytosine(38)-C(5))-methyltransferase n=1 Tax=Cyclocybe aegerita TaxID=1973307 RepID=A0A8S0XR56_CYCAE|nr:unnamed protein product [Cyclocybe aegerita]
MSIRALEFYSGIGGLHLALLRSGIDAQVIRAFDWDQTACQVYETNHGDIVQKADISTLGASSLSPLQADLWLLSPACQPYTVLNPNAKGAKDPRAQSFLHLVQNVLPELSSGDEHPDRLFVENVAGFEMSSTRQILVSTLRAIGYTITEFLLTPLQFGVPNSRLRYYLLAKKSPLSFATIQPSENGVIWRQIPGKGLPWTDPRLDEQVQTSNPPMIHTIKEYLDPNDGSEIYGIPDKVLKKWGRLFDIVKPSSRRTCCFTRGYTQLVERAGSILQENEDLDTTATFDAFLEASNSGDHHVVDILRPLRLRYFSPSELLRIFAFDPPTSAGPSTFVWPEKISTKSKYKLIGNSVNVHVVQQLIMYLFQEPEPM